MRVIIVGAGIGGLSAGIALARNGHSVTIYESAPRLAEVGAGVQVSPNAVKLFFEWGLGPDLLAKAALPQTLYIHNWKDGRVLGETKITPDFEGRYGAPYIVVHRAEMHDVLHRHAVRTGVILYTASRVIGYDFEGGAITLESGQTFHADLVVAVDGINSFARKQFFREADVGAQTTGWAAFRIMVDVEKIIENPETAWITSKQDLHLWVGHNHSAMMYMVLGASTLNVVLSHPDDTDTSVWSSEKMAQEIKRQFEDWDSWSVYNIVITIRETVAHDYSLVALIDMMKPNPANWPVFQVKPLPYLTSKSGKFLLMGDAAHAMAFYLSMGVSMAVEDAAALAECLALLVEDPTTTSIRTALTVFEETRLPRTKAVQQASLQAGNVLHLPDGPEQEARDAAMSSDGDRKTINEDGYGLADTPARDLWYGYDAAEAVREKWATIARQTDSRLE